MSDEPGGRARHAAERTHPPAGPGPVPRSSSRAARRPVRTGSEPRTARSALRLRETLSGVFLAVFAVGAALFWWWAVESSAGSSPGRGVLVVLAAICTALAVAAVLDLGVVGRRLRRERAGHG